MYSTYQSFLNFQFSQFGLDNGAHGFGLVGGKCGKMCDVTIDEGIRGVGGGGDPWNPL